VEPKPEQLNDYRGSPHDLFVVTMYHVHVTRMSTNGIVRHYTFYLRKIEFLCCFNYCKLLLFFHVLF